MHLRAGVVLFLTLFCAFPALPQERGRLYFDYMSIVLPAGWERGSRSEATYSAPSEGDGVRDRCHFSMYPAGGNGGSVLTLLAAAERNVPGNLVPEATPAVEQLPNHWTLARRVYRNRYVPRIFTVVAAIARGNEGQLMFMHFTGGRCAPLADASLRSLRFHSDRHRIEPSGAPLTLEAPPKPAPTVAPYGTRLGTLCRVGTFFCSMSGPVGSPCMCAAPAGPLFGTIFAQ